MTQRIRILIADDHTMVRQGLTQICNAEPDMKVVGQAADGQEASRLALQLDPNVVVMDINMPVLDGVQATRYITENAPAVGVLILTMYRQDQYVFEAIKAGAAGLSAQRRRQRRTAAHDPHRGRRRSAA